MIFYLKQLDTGLLCVMRVVESDDASADLQMMYKAAAVVGVTEGDAVFHKNRLPEGVAYGNPDLDGRFIITRERALKAIATFSWRALRDAKKHLGE